MGDLTTITTIDEKDRKVGAIVPNRAKSHLATITTIDENG